MTPDYVPRRFRLKDHEFKRDLEFIEPLNYVCKKCGYEVQIAWVRRLPSGYGQDGADGFQITGWNSEGLSYMTYWHHINWREVNIPSCKAEKMRRALG